MKTRLLTGSSAKEAMPTFLSLSGALLFVHFFVHLGSFIPEALVFLGLYWLLKKTTESLLNSNPSAH